MKRVLILTVCAALLLGMLVGCGNTSQPETSAPETTAPKAEPAGTLVVSLGAATFELVYDKDGRSLEITGANEAGKPHAEAAQRHLGKECVHAVRSLLRYASDNKIIGDTKTMSARLKFGDVLPKEDFLDTIIIDTQLLADEECTGVRIYKLGTEQIDQTGLILPEPAKEMAARYLGCEPVDLVGEETPADGIYTFTAGDKSCVVDASTGLVSPAQ